MSNTDNSSAIPKSWQRSDRLPHAPRLSIAFIMLATAVTAIVLTATVQVLGQDDRRKVWPMLIVGACAALAGWICAAVLLMAWHGLRGTLWSLEPGEWLALALANVTVMLLGLMLLNVAFYRWGWLRHDLPLREWLLHQARQTIFGELAAVYLLAAVMMRSRPSWCLAKIAASGVCLMPYLIMGPDHVSPRTFAGIFWVLCLAVFSCMTAGIVHDRVDGNARHWIHWSGVAVSAVAMLGLAMLLLLAI